MGGVYELMKGHGNNQGLALVAVLWIVVVMTAIVAVISQTGRLNMKMATGALDEARCRWACRAGVETAIAVLNEDEKDSDCLTDLWSDDAKDFNDVQLERAAFTVRVTDEAGKLNVNTVTKEQLMALPLMESQIADAILDWRDTDDEPRAEGAESGYYENPRYPYTIRNGPFRSIRELLRVKGVTEQQLYGQDNYLNAQMNQDVNSGGSGSASANGGESLGPGWIAFLTCYSYDNNADAQGQSRVNVNQASEQQLQNQLGISSAQARWITQNRGSGFKSIGDLINDNSPKDSGSSADTGTTGNAANSNPSNTNNNKGSKPGNTSDKKSGNSGNTSDNKGGNSGNASGGSNSNEPAQPIDLQTFRQIVDKITVTGETKIPGRVNVNTAPEEVLTAIFGGDDTARLIALAIIGDRAGRPYGYQSIGDLLSVQSVSTAKFKAVADLLTVRSNVYMIQCTGMAAISRAKLQTECVVDRSSDPCTILYWYQGANN